MNPRVRSRLLSVCAWCLLAVGIEVALYFFYFAHEARFHWFTHFFAGGALALLVMTLIAWRTRRPVPYPLVWPILGHLVAMFPDFLFEGGIAHRRWMDVFLGHLSIHFVPGRNWTWYAVFLVSLGLYLWTIDRRTEAEGRSMTTPA